MGTNLKLNKTYTVRYIKANPPAAVTNPAAWEYTLEHHTFKHRNKVTVFEIIAAVKHYNNVLAKYYKPVKKEAPMKTKKTPVNKKATRVSNEIARQEAHITALRKTVYNAYKADNTEKAVRLRRRIYNARKVLKALQADLRKARKAA